MNAITELHGSGVRESEPLTRSGPGGPDAMRINVMTNNVPKMDRTTSGLRTVLLDEIDSLRNGATSEGRAHAVARLANATIATVRLEMDAAEFLGRASETAKVVEQTVKPLTLVA